MLGLADGLAEIDADGELLTLALGLAEGDADTDAEGLLLTEALGLADGELLTEAEGEALTLADGLLLGLLLIDAEGDDPAAVLKLTAPAQNSSDPPKVHVIAFAAAVVWMKYCAPQTHAPPSKSWRCVFAAVPTEAYSWTIAA